MAIVGEVRVGVEPSSLARVEVLRGRAWSFAAGFLGTLAVAVLFGRSGWSWTILALIGLVVGLRGGRRASGRFAAIGLLGYDAAAAIFGWPRDTGAFWWLASAFAAALLWLTVVVGVGWRTGDGATAIAREWRSLTPGWRRAVSALAVVALLGGTGYVGYMGYRSYEFTEAIVATADCRTPADMYGWAFEVINYDPVADARRRGSNPDRMRCTDFGAPAGDEVVTSDGIRLAGWYIPAASGVGPTGPTLLVVPGWKADKTGALEFAPSFHQDYNLLLFDLRNTGQSGGEITSIGLWEQRDVERMLDWLEETRRPRWIGAVGNSLGGATVLAVAAHDQRIRALVLDSMHADIVTSGENILENDFHVPGGPAALSIVTGVSIRVGGDVTSIDPIRMVSRLGNRPVLFIQGTAEQVDPPDEASDRNLRAALAAGVPAEVAYCVGARHGLNVKTCPAEWGSWAVSFLERARAWETR